MELQVSFDDDYSSWSLRQKQDKKRMPLGFWSRKLPEAAKAYTPFEKQLLLWYWALLDTEGLSLDHE